MNYNGWNNNTHKLDGIGGNEPFLNSKQNKMTREEILAKRIITFPENGDMTDLTIKRNVYAAMSEYAQQEVAATTHPLQQKITELLEANQGLREALENIAKRAPHMWISEVANKALKTYK